MLYLIGSRALEHWDNSFKARKGSDWDIVGKPVSTGHLNRVEFHAPDELMTHHICSMYESDFYISMGNLPVNIVRPAGLALIKRSHLWRDWQWEKHNTQYQRHLKKYYDPKDKFQVKLMKERARLTREKFPQGNPNLNQSNEDFFDDAVKKVIDHDWIHEQAAFKGRPMYTRLKRDDSKAWCEADLWQNLHRDAKRMCVAEECYVIANERFCIPSNFTHSPRFAYYKALRKVCTTLCSGWFRDFAIDNFEEIYGLYSESKMDSLQRKIKDKLKEETNE